MKRFGPTRRCLSMLALGVWASSLAPAAAQPVAAVAAQVNPEGVPTVDRDRLDRQDPVLPGPAPARPPRQLPPTVTSPQTASASTLRGVRFAGSTIDPPRLANAARMFAGAPLTRETLQKLANAITAIYAKSDIAFYAVSIPTQDLAKGVVTVKVVEGRIARYTLAKRTRSTPNRLIDAQLQPLLADKPTHKPQLERAIGLLRDIPGQTVKADVRTTSKPDELDLALDISRKQLEITLNVNNRGVVNVTTGVQAQIGIAANGLLREGDSTRFTAAVPFQPSRYQFYSASHTTPIGASGTTFGFNGAYVHTRTRDPEVRGEAKQFGIVIAHPVIRSNQRNLSMTASLDGTNSKNYFLDTAFGGFHTRALRFGASWSVLGKDDGYAITASLSQGLDALGARATFGYSQESYRKANLQLVALKQVNSKVAVKASLRGQYSQDRLPTTERFALGGEGAGLAYRYGIVTADKGASADVELSWRLIGKNATSRGISVFAYADGATARSFARPAYRLDGRNFTLASAGGGLRINPTKTWAATVQLAIPVKSPDASFGKKPRVFFSITRTV
jgi:hemolysin activation/secretion protein